MRVDLFLCMPIQRAEPDVQKLELGTLSVSLKDRVGEDQSDRLSHKGVAVSWG